MMRIKLPNEIEPFAVVAIVLTIASLVVGGISFGLTSDVDAFLVGWGSSSVVAALTGYVIYRLTGGSLKAAPRGIQRIIGIYFWVGMWFLVAAVTYMALAYVAGHAIIAEYLDIIFVGDIAEITIFAAAIRSRASLLPARSMRSAVISVNRRACSISAKDFAMFSRTD